MKKSLASLTIAACLSVTLSAQAAPTDAQVQQLERKMNILTEEVNKLRMGEAGQEPSKIKTGLGPKASKIYSQKQGFSLAGYGEMVYDNFSAQKDDGSASGKKDTVDYLRQVLYFGYKFSDNLLMNSEIEFEHGSTGSGGEVSVEFAYLDFLTHSPFNVRSGMLLVPMGIYNEIHEPPTFFSSRRPNVESNIIPTTWRANGVGLFGDLGTNLSYKLYVVESLRANSAAASGISNSGIRSGRQKGASALAENAALTGRLDYEWTPGSFAGVSFFNGGTSQAEIAGTEANLFLWDVHTRMQFGQLMVQGVYASSTLSDADKINATKGLVGNNSVGSKQYGWYLESGFDVMPFFAKTSEMALVPFVRYERLNTQAEVPSGFSAKASNDKTYWNYGVSFMPDPNVALKLDYQDEQLADNTGTDSWRLASTFMF